MINKLFKSFFAIFLLLFSLNLHADSRPTALADKKLSKDLLNGKGAIVLKFRPYLVKRDSDPKKYASLEEFIASEGEVTTSRFMILYYLGPKNPNKEKRIMVDRLSYLMLVDGPGEYTLTRFIYCPDMLTAVSIRFFKKTTIEVGKVKYLGDLISMSEKVGTVGKTMPEPVKVIYRPEEFREEFNKLLPLTVPHLIEESINDDQTR